MRGEVSLDNGYYHKGNVVTWPALSSTSPDMEATKAFLGKGSKSGEATGTLFIIDKGWGYDIQPYSLLPDEEEILLEPEKRFSVAGVIQGDGLTFINLEMLGTQLSVPEVFGGGGIDFVDHQNTGIIAPKSRMSKKKDGSIPTTNSRASQNSSFWGLPLMRKEIVLSGDVGKVSSRTRIRTVLCKKEVPKRTHNTPFHVPFIFNW